MRRNGFGEWPKNGLHNDGLLCRKKHFFGGRNNSEPCSQNPPTSCSNRNPDADFTLVNQENYLELVGAGDETEGENSSVPFFPLFLK